MIDRVNAGARTSASRLLLPLSICTDRAQCGSSFLTPRLLQPAPRTETANATANRIAPRCVSMQARAPEALERRAASESLGGQGVKRCLSKAHGRGAYAARSLTRI